MNFEVFIPTKVVFGFGKLKELKKYQMPGKKALIVISNGKSVKTNGYLDSVTVQLKDMNINYAIFDKVEANPTLDMINQGGQYAKEQDCDFIIALGGGSVIDSAKAIAILATNGENMWDYIQTGSGKKKKIKNNPLSIVSIPTTAGTGSEVDCAGAFTNMKTKEKVSFKDERLFPKIAIIDPYLSSSVPPRYTAFQGWDALTHSMENMINKNNHEFSTILARQVIQYAGQYLGLATNQGDNYEAREKMALASYLSGIVIHLSGTSSQHALECAMSAIAPNLPHGAGLMILSKAYFQFFIDKHVCDDIFVEMAQLLGNKTANHPDDFIDCIDKILKECHMDNLKMSDYGITKDQFQEIIRSSKLTMNGSYEIDRYSLTDDDCLKILNQAFESEIVKSFE